MQNLISKARIGLTTLAGTLLYGFTVMAAGSSGGSALLQSGDNPNAISSVTGGQTSARQLVLTIVNFFLGFLGLIAVLMIIYGGVMIVTSAGDPAKADKGKKILTYAAIGIVIILLSFAFVSTVLTAGTGQQA